MASKTNQVNFNTLSKIENIPDEAEFVGVLNGQPVRFCFRDIKDCVALNLLDRLPSYKDCDEAKADGMLPGQLFKASSPNTMGVPEGTLICVV